MGTGRGLCSRGVLLAQLPKPPLFSKKKKCQDGLRSLNSLKNSSLFGLGPLDNVSLGLFESQLSTLLTGCCFLFSWHRTWLLIYVIPSLPPLFVLSSTTFKPNLPGMVVQALVLAMLLPFSFCGGCTGYTLPWVQIQSESRVEGDYICFCLLFILFS